jgi:glutamate racemase
MHNVVGDEVTIVDSAETTAAAVRELLLRKDLAQTARPGSVHLMATDGRERFAHVSSTFFGAAVRPDAVEIIDL